MHRRCVDPDKREWYAGRGIKVCRRWRRFVNFLADMGARPPDTVLDRVDNDKGYYPWNCRWATRTESAKNRRSTKFLTHNGITLCQAEWAERLGITKSSFGERVKNWPEDRVFVGRMK